MSDISTHKGCNSSCSTSLQLSKINSQITFSKNEYYIKGTQKFQLDHEYSDSGPFLTWGVLI